ncbi:glucoside xylosyltransferase 2-like [Anthonomus grandis grandis]|uniref:glucoside xylosyltransferase 2-like n=1 Tax=Anthonomus grandis grandis TaxID=2921223 RepID=UPI002166BB38|nr:glucoside xylosyltransferase 2-like [Anthonomus grandis grandis]
MRPKIRFYFYINFAVMISVFLIIFYIQSLEKISLKKSPESFYSQLSASSGESTTESTEFKKGELVVAVVACGDRLIETQTTIKSALMFTKEKLNFIIFADDALRDSFKETLSKWQIFMDNSFEYKIMPLKFPKKDGAEWKKLFKPCAAQRLFLPDILPDVDSLLYVDTDTVFLTPVETIWAHFDRFNKSQMAALAPEHEELNIGWYNRFAKHPFYGKLGVNSGVMLMNLTRMRIFKWTEYVVPIYKKYKLHITWGDQDIINIIFHYHPGKLYIYPCRYNYRPDHCMYTSICKSAEKEGVAVLHGSRGVFHNMEKQPVFKVIYTVFEAFQLGGDLLKDFYQPIEAYLDALEHTKCGKVKNIFLKNVKKFIDFDNT